MAVLTVTVVNILQYVSQISTVYTSNLHKNVLCQLYLNKAEGRRDQECISKGIERPCYY